MCGIAGFFDPRAKTSYQDLSLAAKAMADSIAYRGPDDEVYGSMKTMVLLLATEGFLLLT